MKPIIAIIVLIIVLAGAYLLLARKATAPTQPTVQTTQPAAGSPAAEPAAPATSAGVSATVSAGTTVSTGPAVVTYTDAGFSPKTITVRKGQAVTWVNQSSHPMWVASGQHPVHAAYDGTSLSQHCPAGTSFDECQPVAPGASYSFTFDKVGTWAYHNHVSTSDTGTVIVK